jgi:hypothetical protein
MVERIGLGERRFRAAPTARDGEEIAVLGLVDGDEVVGGRRIVDRLGDESAVLGGQFEEGAGGIRAGEGIDLRVDAVDERVAQERGRADTGGDEADREERDSDPGDLRAQTRAAPPPGDRVGLLRQNVSLARGRARRSCRPSACSRSRAWSG